ncbi:MAG: hypothetical protein K6F68_04430 [Clostridiales bacterium]|nr:hypothetical protein [Clostridiales bacterium]
MKAKRIISLILASLAFVCLLYCGLKGIFVLREYHDLNGTPGSSGADYLGVIVGYGFACAAALLGLILSAVSYFLDERRWLRAILIVLAALIVIAAILPLLLR